MPQSGRGNSRPRTIYVRACTCMSSLDPRLLFVYVRGKEPGVEASVRVAQRDPTSACTRTMAMGFFREEGGAYPAPNCASLVRKQPRNCRADADHYCAKYREVIAK